MLKTYFLTLKIALCLSRFSEAIFKGCVLGFLSNSKLDDLDQRYYSQSDLYREPEYLSQGLWKWEEKAFQSAFSGQKKILLIGAGSGREVLALLKKGVDAHGLECHDKLRGRGNDLLEQHRYPRVIDPMPRSQIPDLKESFDSAILGWGVYTLIRSRGERIRLLKSLKNILPKGAPLLLSFFVHTQPNRYFKVLAGLAGVIRKLLFRPSVEVGDDLCPNFTHTFTRDEIKNELENSGFEMIDFKSTPYGHAIARVMLGEDRLG